MSFHKKLALVQEMINNAQSSIRSAQSLLNELIGSDSTDTALHQKLAAMADRTNEIDADAPVYEGIYDGEKMLTHDGEEFAVPANYASKSKLVAGDELKLVINDQGRFIYKQIGPVERKHIVGTLVREENRYKVVAEGRTFNVLMAAVTFYKGEVGDKVTIIVPIDMESEWAAVDNIIPDFEGGDEDNGDVF